MRNAFAIYKREVKAYFVSPVAYVVLTVFLVMAGLFFITSVNVFSQESFNAQFRRYGLGYELNITEYLAFIFLQNTSVWILFVLPLLSMRLFSEEKRQGTAELLFTYPIRDWETVLGKYCASVTIFILMLALSFVNVLLVSKYAQPEFGHLLSGYLGLFLMGAAFLGVGTFISSLTENQIVAAAGTYGSLLFLYALSWISEAVGPRWGRVLEEVSVVVPFLDFVKGIIEVSNITYYILFVFFFLFLTLRVLESNKWRG